MNRFHSCTGITALAFLCIATSAWAQTDLAKRVSIDVNMVSPQEVFGLLASSLDCEVSVDPGVQRLVTLRVVNVTGRTALSVICESIGCQYRLEGKRLVIEPLRQKAKGGGLKSGITTEQVRQARIEADQLLQSRMTPEQLLQNMKKRLPQGLRFENAPLSSVLEAISKASGVEITAEPAWGMNMVTADVSGQPLMEGLKQVLKSAGADGLVTMGIADGSKLRIKFRVSAKK